jgi:hypothetical protein
MQAANEVQQWFGSRAEIRNLALGTQAFAAAY